MANEFTARVAGISVELGMSIQNKSGIWCKPTVKMDLKIDGGTNPQQREAALLWLLLEFSRSLSLFSLCLFRSCELKHYYLCYL